MAKNNKGVNPLDLAKAICRKNDRVAIGIDMGTSTCTVGVYQNGQVEIILNEDGNDIKPTFAALSEKDEKLVQDLARAQETPCCKKKADPRSTICDMMKLVGRGYYDKDVPHDMQMLPFKVVNVQGQPALEVMCKKTDRRFTPVDISSMIFQQVKEIAECFLGKPVNAAVITVPIYFNEFERKATKEAATNAGFGVLRLMNEPIAAAVAYGFPLQEGCKYALVFDLGGGTLDVSVFLIANGVFDLKATSGNTRLGGKDFDAAIVAHFAKEIKAKHGVDVAKSKEAMEKLQLVCEQAKRCLSKHERVGVKIQGLVNGINFKSSISRTKFEELNADLFNSTLDSVEDALFDANVPKECINQIVLVGGSTKIPKIQSLLKEYFPGKELTQSINPEDAVAFGAAIEAAVMAEEEAEKSTETVHDWAPLSLGIKGAGGIMIVFVPRNTSLPCSVTKEFSTYKDNQPSVLIQVYEGERKMARNNHHLADLELAGLPLARRGIPRIEVTFCVDKSGIIIVTAQEKTTGVKNAMMITKVNTTFFSGIEVERMVSESETFKLEDEELKSTAEARCGLESTCLDLLGCTDCLDEPEYETVCTKATDVLNWLECHPLATREDIICQQESFERTCVIPMGVTVRCCSPEIDGCLTCQQDDDSLSLHTLSE